MTRPPSKSLDELYAMGMTVDEVAAYQRDRALWGWAWWHWGDQWEAHPGRAEVEVLYDSMLDMVEITSLEKEGDDVFVTTVIHDLGCSEPCTCGAWDRAVRTR